MDAALPSMNPSVLRPLSLLALVSGAVVAPAADAFSNLGPAFPNYARDLVAVTGSNASNGFLFTSERSGDLTGFTLAINQYQSFNTAFSLSLYADGGSNTTGALLGTYAGISSGAPASTRDTPLVTVAASGLRLVAGGRYWLVASAPEVNQLAWHANVRYTTAPWLVNGRYAGIGYSGAFSVQVDPVASSVPGPVAALPFASMALRRRKRK
jgi:hypothetical protein